MIRKVLILLCFLLSCSVNAFEIIKLDELNIDYKNYSMLNPNNRNLLIYPEKVKESINLGINIDLLDTGYFDSVIESLTTDSQYRGIGLQLRLGVRLTSWLEAGVWHHSQHVMDRQYTGIGPFPVEDGVQFKLIIYRARPGRASIF